MSQTTHPSTPALDGVRVVDLSHGIAGPMSAMLLADFGADVVKVEPSVDHPDRRRPGWAMWNRGKRRVVADPATGGGAATLRQLVAGADVVIHGGSDQAETEWLRPDVVCRENPSAVYLSVTPYLGETPWAGGEESPELLAAITGVTMKQNSYDGGPVDPTFPVWTYAQAIWAATSAVAALVERQTSGHGQHVTVGGVHGTMVLSTPGLVFDPDAPQPPVTNGPTGPGCLYTMYQCRDGEWIFLAALTEKFQHLAIATLGLDDVLADPRIDGDLERILLPDNHSWVRDRFESTFATRDRDDWVEALTGAGVPVGPLLERDAWLGSEQVESVGMRVELDDPQWGPVAMPGNPVGLSATPPRVDRPSPAVGAADGALDGWAHRTAPQAPAPRSAGPLTGVRVLDLGAVLAGPYAGTLLAELGAEVIKIEIPSGDGFRGRGMAFIRGQRGVAIDLQHQQGRRALYDMVHSADLVLDNYRAGVLQRLGCDYDHLVEHNPSIISVSITAYGQDSPFAGDAAFDSLLQSRAGMLTTQGGRDEPVLPSIPIIDATTAALAALGAVVALHHRRATGVGQRVDVTMAGAATMAQSEELIEAAGRTAARIGGRDFRGPNALDRSYRTKDGWIRLQTSDASEIPASGVIDDPLPADEQGRVAALEAAFALLGRDEAVAALTGAGVPAVPVRLLPELLDDPQYQQWHALTRIDRTPHRPVMAPNRYAAFSRTERDHVLLPPGVGEQTTQVLREYGLDDKRIADLMAAGVVREDGPFVHANFATYR